MGKYSIRELAYLSGVKAHTLRIWEQRYQIITPKRTQTNIRYYDDRDLRSLLNIAFLNQNGYKISKIVALKKEEIGSLVDKISLSVAAYNTQITALILAMVNLDESRFHRVIEVQSELEGFEKTAIHIIFPFLERVGILWQTGEIHAAQEHFISALIRQKLLSAIDRLPTPPPSTRKFLLFLPEGEWHEVGLLFGHFLLKNRGCNVMYLGQSLPFQDLIHIVEVYQPTYILSSITSNPSQQKLLEYMQLLVRHLPESKILLSGRQVLALQAEIPKGITVLSNVRELEILAQEQ
jgi:DNA-binding transcriptional MerR regulator